MTDGRRGASAPDFNPKELLLELACPALKEKNLSAFDAILSSLEGIRNDPNCHTHSFLQSWYVDFFLSK
ncbi:hypothetical protein DV515_00003757 [Chloebia gouldiae]|uniref:Uncharacterized protein n=1 Tax=Chloebia gouldiae TaxID=44316 RepID=A0A3L8STJ6_CHLGU|nr:hypothetical protein DV515_00003757 [Chloebia gouldiae]